MEAEQEEELEVLRSIYEADPCFKEVSTTKFTYKVSYSDDAEDISKSFVLEVEWPAEYPEAVPVCSLNSFFNNHLSAKTKESILLDINQQAADNIGEAVTFTLIEWAKSELAETIEKNVTMREEALSTADTGGGDSPSAQPAAGKKKEKKEQLTKAQKRRLAERFGANAEERPRGWNWVDVIRHLSKTGGAEQPS
eukprot:scpid38005/ scgid21926/ RWD domain-containing protein 4; Protein FAM28A